MKVFQIQQSKVGSNGVYVKGHSEVKKNQSQITFGKDTASRKSQTPTANELRATQTNLKEQISVMLQTETDAKKIKQLNNYQKILDVLLEKGKNPVVNTIKKTPAVTFGNASQKAEAQVAVHTFSAISASIAASLAQAPGLDEAALAVNDVAMAIRICYIYNLSLTKSAAAVLIAPIAGNAMGVKLFSKALTWMPGAGNLLNAGVAASVTEFIGHSIIKKCESGEMQRAIKKIIDKQG